MKWLNKFWGLNVHAIEAAKSVQQLMDPASANKEKGPLGLLICAYSLITTWLGGRNFWMQFEQIWINYFIETQVMSLNLTNRIQ